MRGKVDEVHEMKDNVRITPAYAGKSRHNQQTTRHKQDHPRLCGEKPAIAATINPTGGSPPPMRGKGPLPHVRDWRTQDHPRLCGEKLPVLVYPLHVQGSPPPMRGKAYTMYANGCLQRITPAYAGKSA